MLLRRTLNFGVITAVALRSFRALAQKQVDDSVLGVLMRDRRFATTVRLLYVTGYANAIQRAITVFAPTESGWNSGEYRSFLGYQSPNSNSAPEASAVVALLRGIAVPGIHLPGEFDVTRTLTSLAGSPITVEGGAKNVRWAGRGGVARSANVADDPIIALNGVIYPLDAVVGQ